MSDHVEPTQEEFNNAQDVVTDVLESRCPSLITKVGSVIHELIVRPMAYIMAWIMRNTDAYREKSSVAYLKTSTATVNPIADAVASNYFLERRAGTRSKGLVSFTVTAPYATIAKGSALTIGGTAVIVSSKCILTSAPLSSQGDGVLYVIMIPDGDKWLANVPVETVETGNIEIPAGADVSIEFASSVIESAELLSPITGGRDTETDAELMERCSYSTAESGIGSYYGLRKRLNAAPISVVGMNVVAGEDRPMFRARYNSVNINPGGYVDCYVKCQNQESVGTVTMPVTQADIQAIMANDVTTGYRYTIIPDMAGMEGCYAITRVLTSSQDMPVVKSYDVEFTSIDTLVSAAGARLSCKQGVVISFESSFNDIQEVTVYMAYMPSLRRLQNYMDSDINTFIGQDVCIKAAVPVAVNISCSVEADHSLTDSELDLLKQTMADYVNDLPVGTAAINFSDLRKLCASALPGAELRLPCFIGASCYLSDGSKDTWYSNTGILNIADPANKAYWSYKLSFFTLSISNVRLEQI